MVGGGDPLYLKFWVNRPPLELNAEIPQNQEITPFKVIKFTNFGTNRKPIYDFLLVNNTNLPPILHRFRDIAG